MDQEVASQSLPRQRLNLKAAFSQAYREGEGVQNGRTGNRQLHHVTWVGGLSTSRREGRTALWLDPPPPEKVTPPQNLTPLAQAR